ncbi:MAG: hypothetical protein JSV09_14840 [Thermoplasmata archaeon]|nr:MAG: hypothetical protein JSV09_14840 [Thermoplasmata archaeon]
MKGKKRKILKFETDPFYLYPVKEDMIERLFVDREEEINIVKGILGMRFKDTVEICAVVGGIGVGKSSILYYIINIAKESGLNANFYDNPDDFYSESKKIKRNGISIIDNVDKLDDENARKCYNFIEKHVGKCGGIIFFSDNYTRDKKTLKLRNFTVSQNISLPKGLSREKLRFFLEERMKKCLEKGNKLVFPFDDIAMEIASVRSAGNLRNFLKYAKNGWMVTIGGGGEKVTKKEMKAGMVIVDRALLGSCDLIDMKILWHSTSGDINKSYLAHQCGIDSKTLDSHIEDRLADLITQKRSGKDVLITSIYRYIDDGPEILEKIIEGLSVRKLDVTGEK